jgi:hypothetical protein
MAISQNSSTAVAMDRRISEILPNLADLSLSDPAMAGARETAREIRMQRLKQEQQVAAELLELDDIYDFTKRHPVDTKLPDGPFSQKLKPQARKIKLSPYQYEMINYQRMLLRKNIWYYRDRMSVPRGPCPLHVLKDCWVQVRQQQQQVTAAAAAVGDSCTASSNALSLPAQQQQQQHSSRQCR